MDEASVSLVGVVIIGRNEGARLVKCFDSVQEKVNSVVYVDSGSTDDSVTMSKSRGINTLELNVSTPFTAARARNEGFKRLIQLQPDLHYVQFIDGDCEVVDGWLKSATSFLRRNNEVAVVFGRLRERYPDQSFYNMLCDIEWDTPVGESKSCGGNAMMKVSAFKQVGGFKQNLIAGEEPELCIRLRKKSWKVWRIDCEMMLHDAAMTRLSQWWKRSVRGGYSFAEGAFLHGNSLERHRITESRRSLIWGLLIPFVIVIMSSLYTPWALCFLFIYPLQVVRLAMRGRRTARENWIYAFFLVLGKFPEAIGHIKFQLNRLFNRKIKIIEYK